MAERTGPGPSLPRHPVVIALKPIVEALGGRMLSICDQGPDDLPLVWNGDIIAAVRVTPSAVEVERIFADLERSYGRPLSSISRSEKQAVARTLHDRGVFTVRRAADLVADALGVSRVTVYNYLRDIDARGS